MNRRLRRWRDALIAIGGGIGIGWIAWLVITRDHNSISWLFNQQSIPLGGGTNVVNVILVDFQFSIPLVKLPSWALPRLVRSV